MGSKYDVFWESVSDLLRDLISRAAKYPYAETSNPQLRRIEKCVP